MTNSLQIFHFPVDMFWACVHLQICILAWLTLLLRRDAWVWKPRIRLWPNSLSSTSRLCNPQMWHLLEIFLHITICDTVLHKHTIGVKGTYCNLGLALCYILGIFRVIPPLTSSFVQILDTSTFGYIIWIYTIYIYIYIHIIYIYINIYMYIYIHIYRNYFAC